MYIFQKLLEYKGVIAYASTPSKKKLGWSKTNIVENLKQNEAPKTPAFDCRLAEPRILTRNNFKQRENIPINENTASACTMQKWLQLVALLAGCITLQATSKNPCSATHSKKC